MPSSAFADLWGRLPRDVQARLVADPGRTLTTDDVDALARAGARDAGVLWLDVLQGHTKQWRTSWVFQQYLAGAPSPGGPLLRRQDLERGR